MIYVDEKSLHSFKKINTLTWDTVKNNVYIRLMNIKSVSHYDKDIAFVKVADLAVTFSVQEIDSTEKTLISHMLTVNELTDYGISIDIAYSKALENTLRNRKRRIISLREYMVMHEVAYPLINISEKVKGGFVNEKQSGIIEDISYDGEIEIENILMLTNKNDIFGACYMIIPEILEEVYKRFGENFYIIPLSIHCVMCVRNGYATKNNTKPIHEVEDDILDAIEEFNDTKTNSWKDILSYKAYYYFGDDGKYIFPISAC